MTVANTTGLMASHRGTQAKLVTVMIGPAGETGYAQAIGTDHRDLDPDAVGEEAAERTARAATPIDVEPGEYPVVLGEYALAEVLEYLAFMAFSGLAIEEGRACVELGKKVLWVQRDHLGRWPGSVRDPRADRLRRGPQAPGRARDRWRRSRDRPRQRHRPSRRGCPDRPRAAGPEHVRPAVLEPVHGSRRPAAGRAGGGHGARAARHALPLREHRPPQEGDPDRDDPRRDVPHREWRGGRTRCATSDSPSPSRTPSRGSRPSRARPAWSAPTTPASSAAFPRCGSTAGTSPA